MQQVNEHRVIRRLRQGRSFVYLHTQKLTETELKAAVDAKASLEIDISMDEAGNPYVGHPYSFYPFYHLPYPNNLSIETIISATQEAGLVLVFDCKDVRVLPYVKKTIAAYGSENCLLHAYVKALDFSQNPDEEPHWQQETLSWASVYELSNATKVPFLLSTRGTSLQRLQDIEKKILQAVAGIASSPVLAVGFGRLNDVVPTPSIAKSMQSHNILPLINIDLVANKYLPKRFVGYTDHVTTGNKLRS